MTKTVNIMARMWRVCLPPAPSTGWTSSTVVLAALTKDVTIVLIVRKIAPPCGAVWTLLVRKTLLEMMKSVSSSTTNRMHLMSVRMILSFVLVIANYMVTGRLRVRVIDSPIVPRLYSCLVAVRARGSIVT